MKDRISTQKVSRERKQAMKLLKWILPVSAIAAIVIGVIASSPSGEMQTRQEITFSLEGSGEQAAYGIDGDTVYVNNRLCAVSHSPLDPNNLDQFVSRVMYDGPIEKFRGKTLVFNQCCGMCIEKFPSLWKKERDAILRFHGLTLNK